MKISKRMVVLIVMVILVLALPTTALAAKKVWIARLSSDAELHTVVGADAYGSSFYGTNIGGGSMAFGMQVNGLSGAPTGAHIHAPADTAQTGPVILTLCGNPSPSATGAACPFTDNGDGTFSMTLNGTITSPLLQQWNVTPAQLFQWFDSGMAYVNVHTALNPAGEARGQIYPR